MTKLNKVVVVLDEKKIKEITEGKIDKRTLNTGRPVNKKSARQVRLNKQAFYANVNSKFVKGNQFKVSNGQYNYSQPSNNNEYGCIVDAITNMHVCNVSYIGRTKVQGYTFTLGKKVNIELNLKTLKFVS
tara:strand:+ start:145 stop:534 length:390 start_codon:yes stop_codon:yes gene_type:complete